MPELTQLQKTGIAYQHFTLAQWEAMALVIARSDMADSDKVEILAKFPSVILPSFL